MRGIEKAKLFAMILFFGWLLCACDSHGNSTHATQPVDSIAQTQSDGGSYPPPAHVLVTEAPEFYPGPG